MDHRDAQVEATSAPPMRPFSAAWFRERDALATGRVGVGTRAQELGMSVSAYLTLMYPPTTPIAQQQQARKRRAKEE